ncbi:replication-associated protein [Crucivirus-480]|nr:replication-associated protein [Crucivirus-480]
MAPPVINFGGKIYKSCQIWIKPEKLPSKGSRTYRQQMANSQPRVARWCLTAYNYEGLDYEELLRSLPGIKLYFIGEETCPQTGRAHLQGYIEYGTQMRLTTIKNTFKPTRGKEGNQQFHDHISAWHFIPAKGSREANYKYCSKTRDGDVPNEVFHEWGDRPEKEHNEGKGKRTDLDILKAQFKDGTIKDIKSLQEAEGISVACHKLALEWLGSKEPEGRGQKYIAWIHGTTGVGKTFSVDQACVTLATRLGYSAWRMGANPKWMDGYVGQDIVVIDDMRQKHWDYSTLLRLLDWRPVRCEVKGGHVWWNPKIVFITNPVLPEVAFSSIAAEEGEVDQLMRRIKGDGVHGGIFNFNRKDGTDKTRFLANIGLFCDHEGGLELPGPASPPLGFDSPRFDGPGEGELALDLSFDFGSQLGRQGEPAVHLEGDNRGGLVNGRGRGEGMDYGRDGDGDGGREERGEKRKRGGAYANGFIPPEPSQVGGPQGGAKAPRLMTMAEVAAEMAADTEVEEEEKEMGEEEWLAGIDWADL